MRLRKLLTTVLEVILVFSSMSFVTFADTEEFPNFYGEVSLKNWECEEADYLGNLENLPLTITVVNENDRTEKVEFELEFDAFTGGFSVETFNGSAQMTAIMDRIFQNQNPVEDAWLNEEITDETYLAAVFEGYDVTLNLGEDSHWTAELFEGGVFTTEDVVLDFEAGIDLVVGFYNEFAAEFGEEPIVLTEETRPQTYEEFALFMANLSNETPYDSYEDALRDPELGYTEEQIQELLGEVQQQDAILAEARAATEKYPMELYVLMSLCCDCPVSYEIGHRYMVEKEDGTLEEIELIWEGEADEWGDCYLKGQMGTIISAEDYLMPEYNGSNEEYVGKTFEFTGSYDRWAEGEEEEDWAEYKLEQFELGDYEYDGLILVYVLKEEPAPAIELEVTVADEYTADSGEDFVITGNGELKDFLGVMVDGALVDAENYTVTEGSTIVTLKADYMETLEAGEHRVQMVWTTGMAETVFEIVAEETAAKDEAKDEPKDEQKSESEEKSVVKPVNTEVKKVEKAPETGDRAPIGGFVALLLVAVCGVVALPVLKRKHKEK